MVYFPPTIRSRPLGWGSVVLALAFLVGASLPHGDGASVPDAVAGAVADAPANVPYPGAYAFVDVHVVPMDRLQVMENQTVVVRNGTIREVGPVETTEIPPDATVIQGNGRYLLPGLSDMYVRLPGTSYPEQGLEDLLFLYLANGVTTIRQADGQLGHRTLKTRLEREQVLGPTFLVSSPPFQYRDVLHPDSMESAIRTVALQRWDMLQPSRDLSLYAWDLMIAEIQDYIINPGGPVPDSVGLHHAIASGTSVVDRMEGLIEASASDAYQRRIRAWYAPGDTSAAAVAALEERLARGEVIPNRRTPPPPLDSLAATLDPRKARAVAGKARAQGVWMIPTLSGWEKSQGTATAVELLEAPELRYIPRETRGRWVLEKQILPPVDSLTAARLAETRMTAAKALNDVAGGLVLGTDSPALFNVPGFSVHREMELMVQADITPYEVLIAATRNAARFTATQLNAPGNFGVIEPGNRADLILVDENPLEDLSTIRDRAGVMVKGLWLTAAEIEARLEGIAMRAEGVPADSLGAGAAGN